MSIFHCDYETTSAADIRTVGAYRYACDPSTRILMFAIARDDWPPLVWRFDKEDSVESETAARMFRDVVSSKSCIYAHSTQFEIAISRYRLLEDVGINPPTIEQWRCTQAMCRRAAIPPSLADAAAFLQLGDQKDPVGKALIGIFSDQNKLVTLSLGKERRKSASPILESLVPWEWTMTVGGKTMTVREAWDAFISYCRQDVIVERQVHKALAKFELTGAEFEGFQFDLRMNARGVPVDVAALKKAQALILDHEKVLSARFLELTGLNPGQNAKVLEWLRAGRYPYTDLQAKTVALAMEDRYHMTSEAIEALTIKSELAFAAVKKVSAMLEWVCPDGRVRGAFKFYGASKTGRWTCEGPQFQNMKKPPKWMKRMMEQIYTDLLSGFDNELLRAFYGNPYEVLASLSRYFVRLTGSTIYDVDFSSVEARILPMLIECKRLLDMFERGEDIYIPVGKRLGFDRNVGKTIVLAVQFGGSWRAVMNATGGKLTEKECKAAAKVFREENPEFAPAWKKFHNAFLEAITHPGTWVKATKHVQFGYSKKPPFPRMLMRLPSGRDIVYPLAKAEPITMYKPVNRGFDGEIIEGADAGWSSCPGHQVMEEQHFHTHEFKFWSIVEGKQWGWCKTYGGDLLQSATQGTGVDLLLNGCVEAEKRGFDPFFVVHDECIAPAVGGLDNFISALCTVPSWFKGFPLEAEGEEKLSYSKD